MTILPHSIRGRLVLWFTLLLTCILAGFGVTAYHFNRASGLSRIDDALQQRVALLQSDFRRPPPGGMREMPGRPGPSERGGPRPPPEFGDAGSSDRSLPREGKRPLPPRVDEDASGGRDGFGRKGPFMGGPSRFGGDMRRELTLSDETAALFNDSDPRSYYYAAWSSGGTLIKKSNNAPVELPIPEGNYTGRSYERTRGILREIYHITERSDIVLAGVTIEPVLLASRRFAVIIIAAGLVVLVIGLGGGWIIIDRSLRPVHQIGAAAQRIAAGDLSDRINITDTRSELGGLAAVLNSTFSRLEAAFSDQKNFTADASHELRTPLAVILTEAQRALNRERTAAEYRSTIEVCRDTAQDMRKLTESLLELARLDAGQETMHKEPCDLASVASAACDLVRPLAEERKLRIVMNCASAPLHGDPDRLRQVAVNLLQNAVRYNREGGEIRVTTRADDTHVELGVSDDGTGIAAEDLPRVFERFYRADKARTRAQGGNGLGLSLCKSIVDTHGGEISVISPPGEGATFTVRLPR